MEGLVFLMMFATPVLIIGVPALIILLIVRSILKNQKQKRMGERGEWDGRT